VGVVERYKDPDAIEFQLQPGLTVAQLLSANELPDALLENVMVVVNGTDLARDQWAYFTTRENDLISIYVRPAGGDSGKQIFRLIATIAIAVAAVYFAGPIAGAFGKVGTVTTTVGGVTTTSLTTAGVVAAAVTTAVGTLLLNALVPPPSLNGPSSSGFESGDSYFITGQSNQARPYQVVPVVYGRVKMVGALASQPEVFSAGDSTLFTTLIDWGLGESTYFNVRAGDTQIGFFNATKVDHINVPSYADNLNPSAGLAPVNLQLLQYPLNSQELSIGLSKDGDVGTANTVPTAYSAVIELFFPQGIAYYDKNGNLQTLGVTFKGEYKKLGETEWLPWPAGTEGYAGEPNDHIWFGQGTITNPEDPNPPENPNVTISVPTRVTEGDLFVVTLSFDQQVWGVGEADLDFVAPTPAFVDGFFEKVSETEVTPNRVWQFQYRAPFLPNLQPVQFFIRTNLYNFVDAPPPDGVPFPETSYVSNNFQVVAQGVTEPEDPPPEEDPTLYDRTEGNETYVVITGVIGPFDVGYEPGNLSTWNNSNFTVYVAGEVIPTNTSNPEDYAGVFQDWTSSSGFVGSVLVTEYWTLKNADGSASRVGGRGGNRFYPGFPDINPGTFGGTFSLYGNETRPGKASIVIQFPEQGEYQVRVTRVGDTENSDDKNQYFNAAYWSRIASRGYPFTDIDEGRRSILNLKRFHTMMELRLEASERVQGNLNEISATVVSRLRGHNGSGWLTPVNSRCPAWVVADLLTGYRSQQLGYPTNLQDCPGYVKESDLDILSFRLFAQRCLEWVEYEYKGETFERRRYTTDIVLASDAPMMTTVQNILGMCRAQLILGQNGKLQIMMDEDRADEVRQLFTPANSWNFRGERNFPTIPHALEVEFVSPDLGYQKGEVTVYRPGFDATTATTFEKLKTFGCTEWHMAAQYGMYVFGQMVTRQETFTLSVSAESLVVQRGDVVEVAVDSAALGGAAHLINDQTSGDTFVLSEEPNDYDDAHYTIKTDEGVYQGDVIGQVGRTVQLDRSFSNVRSDGTSVIVIGEKDLVTKKYIISAIRPLQDLSAELTLVPYDERVYRTDEGEFPEWTPGGDGDPQNPENGGNARTENLQGFTYLEYNNRMPISVSSLTWELQTADAQVAGWKVQWTQAGQDTRIDIDTITADKRAYEHRYQSNSNEFGPGTYTVTPIMQLGYTAQGASVFVGRSIDRIAPGPPRKFRVVAEPGWTKFFWERPDAPDIGGYQVYALTKFDNNYEDITEGDFSNSATTLVALVDWDETYHYEPFPFALNGAGFWITCTDTSGNTSEPAYFDGLENGIPKPGLVEPFDIIRDDGPSRLRWLDLVDPNNLIQGYELRFSENENQNNVSPSQWMDFVPPAYNLPSREHEFLLDTNGWPDEGAWWIRARDRFGYYGPWNRTSTGEIDYQIIITDHYQEMFYVDRMPWTKAYTSWTIEGEAADQVNMVQARLYPRQAEGKNLYNSEWLADETDAATYMPRESFEGMNPNGPDGRSGPWLLWETTDPVVIANGLGWFEIAQLPRGDIYHQGQIVVEGYVDGSSIGTEKGIVEWQIEYDEVGPPAPDYFEVKEDDFNEDMMVAEFSRPDAPDNDFCEVRYARRTDMEWEEAELIVRLAYDEQFIGNTGNVFIGFAQQRPGKYMVRFTDTSGNPGGIASDTYELDGGVDGWELIQSIQGHILWEGELVNLERRDGVSSIFMTAGESEGFFYYDETSNIPQLGETRIISETLEAVGGQQDPWETISDWPLLSDVDNMAQTGGGVSNLEIYHEVQLPGSDLWQEFQDSAFPIAGEVKYRIRLVNLTPDEEIGIERSRILVYAKEEPNP
jgi:sulfur carrier protein ThiS